MNNKLIILDRDGVINHDSDDYICEPDDWMLISGSDKAIAKLNAAGYKVAVATNQSGIGRGYFDENTLNAIHSRMYQSLLAANAQIDQLEYCPDHPKRAGPFRKPEPGMLLKILQNLNADAKDTWFVGDSLSDIKCAQNAGCKPALVLTGKGQGTFASVGFSEMNVPVFNDLNDFVETLLNTIKHQD